VVNIQQLYKLVLNWILVRYHLMEVLKEKLFNMLTVPDQP